MYILTYLGTLTVCTIKLPKSVKIGHCLETVKQYFPAPLRCRGRQICEKFGYKDPDHREDNCRSETECTNCQENHPAFWRYCDIYKRRRQRQRKLLEVKFKRNVASFENMRRVGSYTYATVS